MKKSTRKKPTRTRARPQQSGHLEQLLLSPVTPELMCRQILLEVLSNPTEENQQVLKNLIAAAQVGARPDGAAEKIAELEAALARIQEGPQLCGTFLRAIERSGFRSAAEIVMADGTVACAPVKDDQLLSELRVGDTVWVDPQAKAVLSRDPDGPMVGEEATLERLHDDGTVEVTLGERGRQVFHAGRRLLEQLERAEANIGCRVLVCSQRMIAFRALELADSLAHLRFLVREDVPDVLIDRDIGAPPDYLNECSAHLDAELGRSERRREYAIQRCLLYVLTGTSGSGKTLSIQALWNLLYSRTAAHYGVPMETLPHRVIRIRAASVLSQWLGQSDKQIDRLFNEIDQLATERFTLPSGEQVELPVLVIFEEIDSLARRRGEDSIHDRILNTLLERLCLTSQKLRDRLVYLVCTTNVPQLVDSAFFRRAGGREVAFGRLQKQAFVSVLDKHLGRRPVYAASAADPEQARRQVVTDLVDFFYGRNGSDPGQVELTYVGAARPRTCYRREFLNGAIVDRAVQEAADRACWAEEHGDGPEGISSEVLAAAFRRQVDAIVRRLSPGNVGDYLDIPQGERVGAIRRLEQSEVLSLELERAS